jgi:hypothetical protein
MSINSHFWLKAPIDTAPYLFKEILNKSVRVELIETP